MHRTPENLTAGKTELIRAHTTLPQQITAILRDEIRTNFRPGERLPPIRKLAERFDVSFHTVREALSVLAEEGRIERRVGSGTFVSDPIPPRRSQPRSDEDRHVAVLCERDLADPHASYFYRYVPQQLVRFFQEAGFATRLYVGRVAMSAPPQEKLTCLEFLEALDRRQLSGVVVLDEPIGLDWLTALREQHVPIVGSSEPSDYPSLRSDKAQMSRLGMEYLLRQGCRRIALMEWLKPQVPGSPRRDPVLEGFQAALAAAGVEANPRWIRQDLPPGSPGAGWEEFREIWVSEKEKPDGLLVCDDMLFLGAAMAICQMGIRVPEDLLVVTHHNKGSGLLAPFPVAKLEFDLAEYVQLMGGALVKLMRQEPLENRRMVISCELLEPEDVAGTVPVRSHGSSRRAGTNSANEMEMAGTASESHSGDFTLAR